MKNSLAAAMLALLVGTGTTLAQDGSALHDAHLNHLDRDKSGSISLPEYQLFMSEAFSKLDKGHKGYLTKRDVSSILTAQQFTAVDSNRDGRVTRSEFLEHVTRDFRNADKSGDGHLK